jgi:hypothetical protein
MPKNWQSQIKAKDLAFCAEKANFLYQSHFLSLKTRRMMPENKNMTMMDHQKPK